MTTLQLPPFDVDHLAREHAALMRTVARAQAQGTAQARALDRLQGQVMRLRAEVIRRDTALAWAQEDRAALAQAAAGLPRRAVLARRVESLLARVHTASHSSV